MAGYSIRLATLADGPRCNDFHNRHYGTARSLEQWMWEFPDENGALPFAIAECGGEVVGTQALIPIDLIDRGGVFASAKSEETLIAESMRGQGVFAKLYEPLLDYARRRGIAAIWGFTPAAAAFHKAGFELPGRTSQIFRPFRAGAAAALKGGRNSTLTEAFGGAVLGTYGWMRSAFGSKRLHGLTLQTLETAPTWADSLSQEFVRLWGGCTIHRSAAYLKWRIFENPYVKPAMVAAFAGPEPAGFVCYAMTNDKIASIVDIVAVNVPGASAEDVTRVLLAEAANRTCAMGALAIRCWSVTEHPYELVVRRVARKLGWLRIRQGNDAVFMPLGARNVPPFSDWYVSRIFTEGHLG